MLVIWLSLGVLAVLVALAIASIAMNHQFLRKPSQPKLAAQSITSADASSLRAKLGLKALATEDVAPLACGGTGATSAKSARTNLELGAVATDDVVPLERGGTGVQTGAELRALVTDALYSSDSPITLTVDAHAGRLVWLTTADLIGGSHIEFTLPTSAPNGTVFRLRCTTNRNMHPLQHTIFTGPVMVDDGGALTKGALVVGGGQGDFYFLAAQELTFVAYNDDSGFYYFVQGYPQIATL